MPYHLTQGPFRLFIRENIQRSDIYYVLTHAKYQSPCSARWITVVFEINNAIQNVVFSRKITFYGLSYSLIFAVAMSADRVQKSTDVLVIEELRLDFTNHNYGFNHERIAF